MREIVELHKVSVNYVVRNAGKTSMKSSMINLLKGESMDKQIVGLSGISLKVHEGEVLAVIGRNGAGKSTLLKILARVLPPTSGRVLIRGNTAPMLELSAGFNAELTGRENVILYGTLLGRRSEEMRNRAEEICNWAGVSEFIDLPLRIYSSGMLSRLAFAIATDSKADLVLIDEVLSVGDREFQEKSQRRINQMIESSSATVLVTHDLNLVSQIAHKALWIDHGRAMQYGDVNSVIDAYLNA